MEKPKMYNVILTEEQFNLIISKLEHYDRKENKLM